MRHEEAGAFAAQAARDQMRRPALDLHGNGAGPPAGQKSLSAVDLDETPRARLIAYGVAVLAMVLSLLIRWPLWPVLHDAVPHMAFLPAIVVAAYWGGLGPGLLATLLTAVAANYFLTGQFRQLQVISVNDVTALILFVAVGVIVSGLSESRRRAQRRIRAEERQLAEARMELAHVNRVSMMGELAASLSHEITQPIASARNNARAAKNFLDMQPPDLGEVREALSCVVGDTDRAGDIIDRIREHIKKAPPRKGQFDLNEAINEVIVFGRSAIIKNGVSVQTRLSERLFPIRGDRVQLQQVVLNLLLNAVEAMGSREAGPRELLISAEQDHRGVLVAVRDSGPGIDPSHFERVFDAFYTTKSSGMGMGLSICRSIIEAHGGRLWVEANEPRGAVFQFTLPNEQVGP